MDKRHLPCPEERKIKIGLANKGRRRLDLTKRNLKNNPMRNPEVKKKVSEKAKERFKDRTNHPAYGKKKSEETRRKLSETKKRLFKEGKLKAWNKGKQCQNITISLKGYYKTHKHKNLGKKLSQEHRDTLSKVKMGENNPAWKGGISSINGRIRASREYELWRDSIFKRDNYTCQSCFERNGNGHGVYLEAHHLKFVSIYHDLILDINNGVTLCKKCHKEAHKCKI